MKYIKKKKIGFRVVIEDLNMQDAYMTLYAQ